MRGWFWTTIVAGVALSAAPAGAQEIRSFTTPSRKDQQPTEISKEHKPPPGMCRIWLDGVPPNQQPAPTDCATAIKNKPKNGRVIYGDDAAPSDGRKRDPKDKGKKPEGG
jgi:hypothetical protein